MFFHHTESLHLDAPCYYRNQSWLVWGRLLGVPIVCLWSSPPLFWWWLAIWWAFLWTTAVQCWNVFVLINFHNWQGRTKTIPKKPECLHQFWQLHNPHSNLNFKSFHLSDSRDEKNVGQEKRVSEIPEKVRVSIGLLDTFTLSGWSSPINVCLTFNFFSLCNYGDLLVNQC